MSVSTSATKPRRYDSIIFEFSGVESTDTLHGALLIRQNEMVIDIRDPTGNGPYLIIGKKRKTFYAGHNTERGSHVSVDAKWADIDGRYVGFWVEDEDDFYFSFRLPR